MQSNTCEPDTTRNKKYAVHTCHNNMPIGIVQYQSITKQPDLTDYYGESNIENYNSFLKPCILQSQRTMTTIQTGKEIPAAPPQP